MSADQLIMTPVNLTHSLHVLKLLCCQCLDDPYAYVTDHLWLFANHKLIISIIMLRTYVLLCYDNSDSYIPKYFFSILLVCGGVFVLCFIKQQ